MMHVVCAVEVGWRGMRECSTALGRQGAVVEVLLKGEVEPAVLGMITRRPGVTIRAVAARRFAWTLAGRVLAGGHASDMRLLIVNKPKTQRWTSAVGRLRRWRVLRLEEIEGGYRLFDARGQETHLLPLTPPLLGALPADGGRLPTTGRQTDAGQPSSNTSQGPASSFQEVVG